MRRKLALSAVAILSLLVGCQTYQSSTENTKEFEEKLLVFSIAESENDASRELWTSQRMNEAESVSPIVISDEELQTLLNEEINERPIRKILSLAVDPASDDKSIDRTRRAPTHRHPFSVAGRLFFGSGGHCTAQFVRENVLLTAAHCVADTSGRRYQNILFKRVYDGTGKGISYFPECIIVNRDAFRGDDYDVRWDYAFIVTTQESEAGHAGLEIDTPTRTWTAAGYPFDVDGGNVMQFTDGYRRQEGGHIVEMAGNNMNQGSSGGFWLDGLYSRNAVVMLNSFKSGNNPNMWSPRFEGRFGRFFERAERGCQTSLK